MNERKHPNNKRQSQAGTHLYRKDAAARKGFRKNEPMKQTSGSARDHADELRTGDRIVVTIKRLGINGEGVGYYRRK
ncbi:23S rRNA (uracil-5-)-methyltransferase RumA, partial [Paenibacillus sp. AR247]